MVLVVLFFSVEILLGFLVDACDFVRIEYSKNSCHTVCSTPEWSYSVTHTQSNFKRDQTGPMRPKGRVDSVWMFSVVV